MDKLLKELDNIRCRYLFALGELSNDDALLLIQSVMAKHFGVSANDYRIITDAKVIFNSWI